MEVKNVMETRDDLKSKLKEVGYVIPKMSEAILHLRNEVSEGKDTTCRLQRYINRLLSLGLTRTIDFLLIGSFVTVGNGTSLYAGEDNCRSLINSTI